MITFTIFGTTVTLSVVLLIFIGILFVFTLAALLWGISRYQKNRAIEKTRELIKVIIPQMVMEYSDIPAHRAWVGTLSEHGYLTPLFSPGVNIVLGTPEMGSTSIFRYVLSKINTYYSENACMCTYVDVTQIAQASKTIGYVPIEDVYRSIIRSGVQVPIKQLQSRMGMSLFRRTGLEKYLERTENILQASLSKLPPTAVRQSLFQIWQIMGIQRVVFMIGSITAIDPNSVPALLGYLLRTFGHTPSVSFIISGDPATLVLNKRTEDGNIGAQVSHDLRIVLDLPNLLLSHNSFDREVDSVRLGYLAKLLQVSHPEISNPAMLQNLFLPPDAWKAVFDMSSGNLEAILESFEKIIDFHNLTHKKVTLKLIPRLLANEMDGKKISMGENDDA